MPFSALSLLPLLPLSLFPHSIAFQVEFLGGGISIPQKGPVLGRNLKRAGSRRHTRQDAGDLGRVLLMRDVVAKRADEELSLLDCVVFLGTLEI